MTTERVVSRYPATITPSATRGLRGVTERTAGDTEREMEKFISAPPSRNNRSIFA